MFESIKFNPSAFIDTLPYMGLGMAGIFAVIAIIILAVYVLGFIGKKISDKDDENN